MKEKIKLANELIDQGKVERISENFWKVGDHTIRRQIKQGRTLFTCSCPNFTMYCNERPLCKHLLAVFYFENQNLKLKKLIRENLEVLEVHKKAGMNISNEWAENLLNDLKSFI